MPWGFVLGGPCKKDLEYVREMKGTPFLGMLI